MIDTSTLLKKIDTPVTRGYQSVNFQARQD